MPGMGPVRPRMGSFIPGKGLLRPRKDSQDRDGPS